MKRDMDLIRQIMLAVEESEDPTFIITYLDGYTLDDIGFHVELLGDYGLLSDVNVTRSGNDRVMAIKTGGLTWRGFDYLDTIRSEKVWTKAFEYQSVCHCSKTCVRICGF